MSLEKLREHRTVWQSKPVLRRIYDVWFRLLSESAPGRRVVEIGAGPGFLAEWAESRRAQGMWVATDLVPAPWNHVAADASRLPFRSGGVDHIVGVDVLHHLAEPRRFFEEASRVLTPGGAVVLVEPWVTILSYPIYRWLHPEGCDLWLDPWRPFARGSAKEAFEGDAAVGWRIVRSATPELWSRLGFEPPRFQIANGFAYLLRLGFRRRSLLPAPLLTLLLRLDAWLSPLAGWLGMRALVVWRRAP